eukprot:CAMPEP_0119322686 /NCGR_PEP_ID=MMETSP1333-20130426/58907_1 /TAXON_ID=418940 /ORGANISM="Scyphosphaera apsteinii, Strain RCC1455" /LENGTH=50 /DNA_ID=CAMNT_0007329973 /DNA_START=49 /DNA_END=201 /DNA_ORIENTATION=-
MSDAFLHGASPRGAGTGGGGATCRLLPRTTHTAVWERRRDAAEAGPDRET